MTNDHDGITICQVVLSEIWRDLIMVNHCKMWIIPVVYAGFRLRWLNLITFHQELGIFADFCNSLSLWCLMQMHQLFVSSMVSNFKSFERQLPCKFVMVSVFTFCCTRLLNAKLSFQVDIFSYLSNTCVLIEVKYLWITTSYTNFAPNIKHQVYQSKK